MEYRSQEDQRKAVKEEIQFLVRFIARQLSKSNDKEEKQNFHRVFLVLTGMLGKTQEELEQEAIAEVLGYTREDI